MSGVDLDLGGPRARVDHLLQHLPLLRGVALHRLDQIGNEIGAALILVEHVRPLRLGPLLIARNVVDAAAREQQADDDGEKQAAAEAKNAECTAHATTPMGD